MTIMAGISMRSNAEQYLWQPGILGTWDQVKIPIRPFVHSLFGLQCPRRFWSLD